MKFTLFFLLVIMNASLVVAFKETGNQYFNFIQGVLFGGVAFLAVKIY